MLALGPVGSLGSRLESRIKTFPKCEMRAERRSSCCPCWRWWYTTPCHLPEGRTGHRKINSIINLNCHAELLNAFTADWNLHPSGLLQEKNLSLSDGADVSKQKIQSISDQKIPYLQEDESFMLRPLPHCFTSPNTHLCCQPPSRRTTLPEEVLVSCKAELGAEQKEEKWE